MNSEELEISLRTEFESYLKGVFAEMRQEISQLQEKLDTELERHKSELANVFSSVLNKAETDQELDAGFKETVTEHLRLAKDEGARITATAIAEAEELEKASAPSTGSIEIYEAVNDISTKQSQSEILKSLVHQAGQFAPRGAFFIIKNDHLVGWRVFGSENASTDEKLREIFLPLSSDSILSDAVKSLQTIKNSSASYSDDAELFDRLEFSDPQQMTAIPLVARGRGVAVLYADNGASGANVNAEALETLVRVAGLTVEVLASSKGSVAVKKETPKKAFTSAEEYSTPVTNYSEPQVQPETQEVSNASAVGSTYEESSYTTPVTESQQEVVSNYSRDSYSDTESEQAAENSYNAEPAQEVETSYNTEAAVQEVENSYATSAFAPEHIYDPEPSIAPSVREAQVEESAEQLPEQSFVSGNEQTDDYKVEETENYDAYKTEELTPAVSFRETEESSYYEQPARQEEVSYEQPIQQTEETPQAESTYPTYGESNWSQPVETQNYSAQEYAENFAKETDPTEYAKDFSYQPEETEESKDFVYKPATEETKVSAADVATEYQYETPVEKTDNYQYETPVEKADDYQYEAPKTQSFGNYETEQNQSYTAPSESFTPTAEQTYGTFEPRTEPKTETPTYSYEPVVSSPVQTETPRTRLSERNVDLPIEVSEDERRLHNDARRFARLLVSEIKLYNEQKVKEGRESGDLYDRLREAIDRSREMYDKRVQPPVAAKFDYFHYEVVNTLAEGDANKLGIGYPGSSLQ